jgi:hypothetical protein
MQNPNPYRFTGISDFVAAEGIKPSFAAKIPSLFLVGRVADALSQIPTAKPEHRAEMYAGAREAIEALKASVATVEAAYAHVLAACPTAEMIAQAAATTSKTPKGTKP